MTIVMMSYGILGGLISAMTVGVTGGGFSLVFNGYLSGAAACGLAAAGLLMARCALRTALAWTPRQPAYS